MDVKVIDACLLSAIEALGLPRAREASPYVVLSVRGDDVRVSSRWTAKVYRNAQGQLKLVTNDYHTLEQLLSGYTIRKENVIRVDDSGWGFPLGGVMIGAERAGRIETDIVDVRYFQGERFRTHAYLDEAARVTAELVRKLDGRPDDTLVEICTGYVNSKSKEALRRAGYEVKVTEITGLLQNELEGRFKGYIESLGYRAYFDPKETRDPASAFRKVIDWIMQDPERLKIAKTGWKYFDRILQ